MCAANHSRECIHLQAWLSHWKSLWIVQRRWYWPRVVSVYFGIKSLCWPYFLYVDSAQRSDLAPFLFLEIWAVVNNFLRLSPLYTQVNSSVSSPNITFYCNFQLLSIPIKIFGVVNLLSGWNNSPMWQCVSVLKHSQLIFWKRIIWWLFYFQACEFLLPNT